MPSPEDRTRAAAAAYVSSLVAARAGAATEDEFWQEKSSNRAYQQLVKSALEGREGLRAGFALVMLLPASTCDMGADRKVEPVRTEVRTEGSVQVTDNGLVGAIIRLLEWVRCWRRA